MLAGIVLLVLGLINVESDSGRAMLVAGMLLGSLGGLDTVLREHFGGFKSHAVVLGALPAVLTAGALFFARAPWIAVPLAGAAVFAAAFTAFRRAFRARS